MEQVNSSKKGCPVSESGNINESVLKPKLRIKVPQTLPLKNHLIANYYDAVDTLHTKVDEESVMVPVVCTEKVCKASIMGVPGRGDIPRTPAEVYKEAEVFMKLFYRSVHSENSIKHRARMVEIKEEIDRTGTYQLKDNELAFGAKTAWRNATRCIGRMTWKNLTIYDCRHVTTARGMFESLCTHIKYSTNKGNINSAISIFPQRTDGKHDYRIWNAQLLGYAGYRQPDGSVIGDPVRVEFTEICQKLGWKGEGTAWDILPLVLSADGKAPEYFDIPREIVMEVKMEHPTYDWFRDLDLQWYAVPAVANMRMDCGGLEFTATAFNGWYMSTEIACRSFCDINRLNIIEKVATKMGLDTTAKPPLWKDKALVEVNVAVLHSFQRDQVTIQDHHTASDTFMTHLKIENRIRGGCPSDWIWIVPPMSASLTAVYHQEMALYFPRPSYDYQDVAWKGYVWEKPDGSGGVRKKFSFRQIARAVRFTSKLFSTALSKRIKATILYASETGKSEQYARDLGTIFGYAFNTQVMCMSEYDFFSIEHETLLLIVASTFGNGEPPGNGIEFLEHLFVMLNEDKKNRNEEMELTQGSGSSAKLKTPIANTLKRTSSVLATSMEYNRQTSKHSLQNQTSRISHRGSIVPSEHMPVLSNVRFAVFGLGSSAYPKYCNFAVTVDNVLCELGGERLIPVARGDELCAQEQTFRKWTSDIFQVACETFCLDENEMMANAQKAFDTVPLTPETVKFVKPSADVTLLKALETVQKKKLITLKVNKIECLGKNEATNGSTIYVDLAVKNELKYEPGDHIAILPSNSKEIVDALLSRFSDIEDYDCKLQIQIMTERLTPLGISKTWSNHAKLPPVSVRDIFTKFVDITSPPKIPVLKYLATACTDGKDAKKIRELVADTTKYDDWCYFHWPHMAEVLAQFPSCKPQGSLLAALLPPLQPRRYSISSSPLAHPDKIHLTVAVVVFRAENGNGPIRQGVCSTYLEKLQPDEEIIAFIRKAQSFHMPKNLSSPIIMVGPGTGIAPFRGFWHHRRHQVKNSTEKPGPVWLYFGCKYKGMDLYKDEKQQAVKEGVLQKASVVMSREPGMDKRYVQECLEEDGKKLTRLLVKDEGHFYVCGDIKMADDVREKLKAIIMEHEKMSEEEAEEYLITMVNEDRYHQDIYGVTFRTAEVNSASRETAKRTRLESLK